MLKNKKITLIIGGGIAAYKSLDLIRRLKEKGASVRGILTAGGAEFITALSVASLTEQKCYTDLFSLTDEAEMGHIRLSREADLLLVVPATADLMAKMAQGFANDLASTVLLATDKPVMIAPAMNVEMWHHKATQRNAETLKADGIHFIGPVEGVMACGETGFGRMTEVADIIEEVASFFAKKSERSSTKTSLHGKHALVTAGPTQEPIDPVRYIANRSSGKQGYAIANALYERGAKVTLVSGPTNLPVPKGVTMVKVNTALEMYEATQKALPADIAVFVAAVADWRIADAAQQKIQKTDKGLPILNFTENPDILAMVSALPSGKRPNLVVGFAAETENVVTFAQEKRIRKGCDWIVANDVSTSSGIMGGDHNEAHLIKADTVVHWQKIEKQALAEKIATEISNHFTH